MKRLRPRLERFFHGGSWWGIIGSGRWGYIIAKELPDGTYGPPIYAGSIARNN